MSPLRLLFLPRIPGALPQDMVLDQGRLSPRAPADPLTEGSAVVVVPGEDVLCRWLELPARDAQAASTAAFLLEGELAQPRDRLHVALGPPEADGTRLAVVVDRGRMETWLAAIADAGATPLAIVPDCLLLPQPDAEVAAAVRLGDTYAVRGHRLALACEAELLPLVMAERAHVRVDDEAEVARILALGASQPMLDLRQGVFAPARPRDRSGWLLPALVAAALVLTLAVPGVTALRHHLAADQALQQAEALAGPGEGPPVERLRARLITAQASGGFPLAAAAVFAAVETIEGMEVRDLTYDASGVFRLTAAHANYSDVEGLRQGLARAGLAVEETSTMEEDGRIVSDLALRPQS